DRVQNENSFLSRIGYGFKNPSLAFPPPFPTVSLPPDGAPARIFLSHFSYLNIEHRPTLVNLSANRFRLTNSPIQVSQQQSQSTSSGKVSSSRVIMTGGRPIGTSTPFDL